MKYRIFRIPIYAWKVIVIEVESKDDAPKVNRYIKLLKIDSRYLEEIEDNIKKDVINGGGHYFNTSYKISMILLYRMTNELKRLEILGHEKRHLEDKIINFLHLKGTEAKAYLAGYLTEQIFKPYK